ncbi:hypothetical protein PsorP6_005274 [Peronosclerospora sorghi]|uniref:Uncharacterized protein n=1 Tax=Peronosclerospora sorghi TaxID=230839 RepID=A0ACC0W3X3_9STRA|nr:hypothetical protein PsorP6_005274 [Peronosclerospora sorghi]
MRFGVYHYFKEESAVGRNDGNRISTVYNVLLGMIGVVIGGAVGNPANINQLVLMQDDLNTHVLASQAAGLVATTTCAPADVVKTRLMNMQENEYKSFVLVVKQ